MKYFHISAEFEIMEKPAWLDDFRKKHDSPYAFHITLKNPTTVRDQDVKQLKIKLAEIIKESNIKNKKLEFEFNEVMYGGTNSGKCIMLLAKNSEKLVKLQHLMSKKLTPLGKYLKPIYAKFEKNFKPHLTIARHLDKEQFKLAKQNIQKDTKVIGTLLRISLTIVDEPTEQQWTDPANKTYFELITQK